jgi:hypothetical protein
MDSEQYLVEVICRQRAVYRVRAKDAGAARKQATARWRGGEPSDLPGFDWCDLEATYVSPAPEPVAETQDQELLLRFIRERERLLLRLGGSQLDASLNDAISSTQAAMDLGWYRRASANEQPKPDLVRAGQALERLCLEKKLVCFERTRARDGERGEIRLYCTPGYLERLSESLEVATGHPVS